MVREMHYLTEYLDPDAAAFGQRRIHRVNHAARKNKIKRLIREMGVNNPTRNAVRDVLKREGIGINNGDLGDIIEEIEREKLSNGPSA
jgi:hypothetical protein